MRKTVLIGGLAVLAMAGCARRPDAIAPATIPVSAYSNLACPELTSELTREKENLATLSKAQNDAATGDAVGVFLVGVPVSSVTGGDKEGLIAVSKGKVQAIEGAMRSKGC